MMSIKVKDAGLAPSHPGLTAEEIDVSRLIQGDIPLAERPFHLVAQEIGLTEGEVLSIAGKLRERGIIRKFGAIVRHQRAGYIHNVMVMWAVPPGECEAAGKRLASFPEITHCYERTPPFAGRYNLFTMVHFRKKTDEDLLRKIAATVNVEDFRVLMSLEEFKKNSMEYF